MIMRRSSRASLCALASFAYALSGCSGGASSPSPHPRASATATAFASASPVATATATSGTTTVTGTASDAVDTPGPVTGTVALPAGSPIALSSLTITTSAGSAPVSASGAYTVQGFPNGHALATVTLPNGDPVLFGFIGTGATTVDATSTAVVFGFFGCSAFVLTPDVRAQAPALIASSSGFGTLTAAVASALASGTDPLGSANANLAQALVTYVRGIVAASGTTQNASARRLRNAIAISPVGASTGSGVSLIQEFPDGLHFLNTYRRRAVAEVDRVSYVPSGSTSPVPAPTRLTATPLPILPVNGLNGGVLPAIDDIFNSFFNQAGNPSQYAPTTSSSIALPLVDGSASTQYLVTLLGPGANLGTFLSLNDADATVQFNTELYYYIVDLAVPFITTVVLPLEANAVDKALATDGGADIINELLTDGGTLLPQLQADFQPDSKGHIDPLPAINDAMRNLTENPTYLNVIEQFIQKAVALNIGPNSASAIGNAFEHFNKVIEALDFGLAAFDATVVASNLLASNEADQYTVTVVPDRLTLTPSSQTLTGATTGTLTATDLSDTGSDATPLQYTWTNTGNFGHLTDGIAGHTDSFTTTQSTVTYTSTGAAAGTDTITVQIATLQGPKSPPQPVGPLLTGTVTVQLPTVASGKVEIDPKCVYFTGTASGMQQFTATANLPQGDSITGYQWSILYSPNVNASLDVPASSIVNTSTSETVYASDSNTATLSVGPATGSTYQVQVGVEVMYAPQSRSLPDPTAVVNIYGGSANNDCPPGSPNPSGRVRRI